MADEVLYMAGLLAAVFAVTFALRAFPFLLSRGGGGARSPMAGRICALVSPVAIACLTVYAFSDLEWRTFAPYVSGALVVALQLAFRNGLLSIFSGTALYMALVR